MDFVKKALYLMCLVGIMSCAPADGTGPVEPDAPDAEPSSPLPRSFRELHLPALTPAFSGSGARCDKFIDEFGELGPYGEIIRDTIYYITNQYPSRKVSLLLDSDLAYGVNGFLQLCPKFAQFNEDEKIHFWVWVFASISWHESKCVTGNNLVGANNPNGLSLGVLHMPHDLRYRFDYSNQSLGTGSCREYHPTGGVNVEGFWITDEAMLDPRLNLKCGLDALITALRGFHTDECYRSWNHTEAQPTRSCTPSIFNNYWAAFKSERMGISQLIKQHPLCH